MATGVAELHRFGETVQDFRYITTHMDAVVLSKS